MTEQMTLRIDSGVTSGIEAESTGIESDHRIGGESLGLAAIARHHSFGMCEDGWGRVVLAMASYDGQERVESTVGCFKKWRWILNSFCWLKGWMLDLGWLEGGRLIRWRGGQSLVEDWPGWIDGLVGSTNQTRVFNVILLTKMLQICDTEDIAESFL